MQLCFEQADLTLDTELRRGETTLLVAHLVNGKGSRSLKFRTMVLVASVGGFSDEARRISWIANPLFDSDVWTKSKIWFNFVSELFINSKRYRIFFEIEIVVQLFSKKLYEPTFCRKSFVFLSLKDGKIESF